MGGAATELHDENRHAYLQELENYSSSWPAGCMKASCPHPVLITQQHQDQVRNLHEALNLAIEDIIERWWTDKDAQFSRRMPLEPEEESLLQWMNSEEDLFPPYSNRQGSWRPDFLLEHDDTLGMEVFRICEINARFCWNGYMVAAFGQAGLSTFDIESRGLEDAMDPEKVLRGLMGLFNHDLPLHLLKGDEYGIDIFMAIEFAKERLGIEPQLITPDALRLVPDARERTGYKLCCLAQPNASTTLTAPSGETVEEIYQVGLEIHQREFRAFEPEMKRQITLRCFNDMRTILLAHDKRMLGLVREELPSLVSRNVLSPEQANWLEIGITPTILPGSTALNKFIASCNSSEYYKDDYILKPIRSGKGAGIIFGDEANQRDWTNKLETLRSAQIKSGMTSYVVQRKVHQPYYDIPMGPDGIPQRCHMVGTYHAVNGHFLGLGAWRCSPGRLCAVSTGATWVNSVVKKHDKCAGNH
ncbi:uncharacterized protein N7459_009533 [Penicillium hispanicum]|uniref:uncharacterized protein n=1 Tax=Penicillium hispanicum TaxID=1080232 RepID=UPI002541EDCD|nr:uncharacterized protein N7459_009533 [Penicillium hispanicum]KAJ5570103.1 hypothetical protein N7459_009533 [Penicillium hispanicum]